MHQAAAFLLLQQLRKEEEMERNWGGKQADEAVHKATCQSCPLMV